MAVPQVSCTAGAGAVPQGATVTVTAATNSVLPVTLSFSSSAGQLAVNGSTAVLSTAGVSPGTVTVGCKATDNQGQSSQASTAVMVQGTGTQPSQPVTGTTAVASTVTVLTASQTVVGAGQGTILTAGVSGAGTPTGSITFMDGSTVLGTVALSNSGQASLASGALSAGTHTLQADFNGSSAYAASASSGVTVIAAPPPQISCMAANSTVTSGGTATIVAAVASGRPVTISFSSSAGSLLVNGNTAVLATTGLSPEVVTVSCKAMDDLGQVASANTGVSIQAGVAATSTVLTAAPTTVATGQSTLLTASVSSSGGTPSGMVTFVDGSTVLGSTALTSSGQAVIGSGALSAGTHSIQAIFAGNSSYMASTSSTVAIAAVAPPQVSCAAGTSTVTLGGTSVITASATSSRPVTLSFSSSAGSLTANGSTAVLSTAGVSPGTVTVSCKGTDDLGQSGTGSAVVTVAPAATTTTLVASPTVVAAGQSALLTASVSSSSGTPSGAMVTFVDGNTVLGATALTSSGQAMIGSGALSAGTHSIQARFAGNGSYTASASSTLTVVAAAPPQVSCVSGTGTVSTGGSATITATATSVRPVTWSFSSNAGSLATSGSSAVLSTAGVAPGTVTVSCKGTDDLGQSGSASATVTVQSAAAASTATVLAAAPMVVDAGQGTVLTAAVSAPSGTPTGTVTFVDGSTVLGTVGLSSSGQAGLASGALSAGTHTVQARFAGNSTYAASSSTTLTVVAAAPPQVTCTAATGTVVEGGTVTITAAATSVRPVTLSFSSSAGSLASSAGALAASGSTAVLSTTGVSPQTVTVNCKGTDDLGQSGSASAAVTVQSQTGEQSLTAFSFVDSVGVNVHLHDANTPYVYAFPQFQSSIMALGVHHYRNGIDPYALPFEYQNAESLAAVGIKADWLIDANDTPVNINAIYANAPDSVEAFEGPNEDDAIAGAPEIAFMTMLNQTVRGNPGTQNATIYGPTFTQISSVTAQQGTLTPFINAGSMHDYYFPRYPETPAYGSSFFNCGGYGTMSFNICLAEVDSPGIGVVSTETGYASGEQSDSVLAKYIARTLFGHLSMGVMRTYLYEFVDEVGSPGFGLVQSDFTPKPAYTELQNLISLFSDSTFSTPGKLNFSLSGNTANLYHVLFQKQDGTWLVAFWLGVESGEEVSPYQTDNVPAQSITLTTAAQVGGAQVFTFDSNGVMSSSAVTVQQGQMTLSATDQISILELSPGSN